MIVKTDSDMVSKIDLGILGLGALAVFLIVRGGGKFLENLKFPELPSIGDITFPDFNLPEINIPSIGNIIPNPFQSNDEPFGGEPIEDPVPSGQPEGSSVRIIQDALGNVTKIFKGGSEILTPEGPALPAERPLNLLGFANNEVAESEFLQPEGAGMFVGGGIFDTPISNLSLNSIIERFGVGATEAADIRARANDDFGDFDFGSNTGQGIGSVFEEIQNRMSGFTESNVSDERFEGQTATQIFQRLVGGNINNF